MPRKASKAKRANNLADSILIALISLVTPTLRIFRLGRSLFLLSWSVARSGNPSQSIGYMSGYRRQRAVAPRQIAVQPQQHRWNVIKRHSPGDEKEEVT
jgi:hypothetical protein